MAAPYFCQLRGGPDSRIVEKTETVAGRPTSWAYTYDKAGRPTGAKRPGRTVCDIGYDREGRRSRDYCPHLDTHCLSLSSKSRDRRGARTPNPRNA